MSLRTDPIFLNGVNFSKLASAGSGDGKARPFGGLFFSGSNGMSFFGRSWIIPSEDIPGFDWKRESGALDRAGAHRFFHTS